MPDDQGQELDSFTYVKAAFKWQYNWIILSGLGLLALISQNPMPLVLAAGVELIYLSLLPQSSRFRRLVRSWKYAEEKRRLEMQLVAQFQALPPEMRLRYADLDKVCRNIRENYRGLSSASQMFTGQMDDRLKGLQQSDLRLLQAANQYRQYLHSTDPNLIQRDLKRLQEGLSKDAPKVQEINKKRIEILTKRLEKFDKAQENCGVVDAQCAAVEEVLQLIRDQSVTMRDPQQVSDQLDSLVHDVEHTEQTVREVEAIFDLAAPEMMGQIAPMAEMPSPPSMTRNPRTGLRN